MRWCYLGVCSWCVISACLAPLAARQSKGGPAAPQNQARDAKLLAGSTSRVYKTVGKTDLSLHIFNPPGFQVRDQRPAIVFFFGGGWTTGTPTQFAPHCHYLASRGMVAIAADYRIRSRNQSTVEQSTADAKSALRWVRAHARELGIDPQRIAAGGGSAGGHLAASTATVEIPDEPGEDKTVSSVPNALVLYNPPLVLPSLAQLKLKAVAAKRDPLPPFSGDPLVVSPIHHIRAGQPPALILHGTADKTVPFETAEKFRDAYVKAGNRCELVAYQGEDHGFFNWNRDDKKHFVGTLTKADEFLKSLGWITGTPNVKEYFQSRLNRLKK